MSDFISSFWSLWVMAIVAFGIIFCVAVLLFGAQARAATAEDKTTGHVWDGDLRELNNPLPRWWMGLFVITVVFSLAYLVLYPGLGSAAGTLGWSSDKQYQDERAKAQAAAAPLYARFATLDAPALAADSQAMAIGERLFLNNCAACHGSDARGSKGFPNLTDTDWLWGDSLDAIKEAIAKGRTGVMPPMAAAVGSAQDVRNVAHYVLSLSGSPHDAIAAQLGREKFAACAACHGPGGKGNPALGAPNLTDKVWLHGWGEEAIISIITQGKNNMMPAHASRLTPEQIHVLGAYVWQLSRPAQVATK